MGPLQIVHGAPRIECPLHLRQVAEAPHCEHFILQRAVKALVLAARLRVTWPGMHHPDAELEQPDLEPGPVDAGTVAPRRAVVGVEGIGQAIAPEGGGQMILHGQPLFVGTGFQTQGIPRMIVDHGQRVAVGPVDQRHVAFEVHLPQLIWRLFLETMPWIRRRALRRFDSSVPAQDLVHRGRHRHRQSVPLQTVRDLAGAPRRMFVAYRQHLRFGASLAALGCGMRPSRAISQFPIAGFPACQPLVADVGTDREPAT
jgi:hypothetical protein